MKAYCESPEIGILPVALVDCVDEEIAPGVWLITNPRWQPKVNKWTALANVGGALAVVELKVWIPRETEAVA